MSEYRRLRINERVRPGKLGTIPVLFVVWGHKKPRTGNRIQIRLANPAGGSRKWDLEMPREVAVEDIHDDGYVVMSQ